MSNKIKALLLTLLTIGLFFLLVYIAWINPIIIIHILVIGVSIFAIYAIYTGIYSYLERKNE